MRSAVVVPEGNAVQVAVEWHDMDGVPEVPASVRYQVFDYDSRAKASEIVSVSPVTASMEITIPGTDLPAGSALRRRLTIQLEATYAGGDKHTEDVGIYVAKGFAWT